MQEEVTPRLHFIKFENVYIETCLDFIKDHLVNTETKDIKATGGGAHKFKELIERKLGLKWVSALSIVCSAAVYCKTERGEQVSDMSIIYLSIVLFFTISFKYSSFLQKHHVFITELQYRLLVVKSTERPFT